MSNHESIETDVTDVGCGTTAEAPRILLVDDAAMFRDIGALYLARAGDVTTAASGDEGLERTRALRPDIVLLDLHMPGRDGDDVCSAIKADPELREIPVVMLVGVDDPQEWGRAVRAGADDVLAKPLSRVALNDTVQRFVNRPAPRGLPRVQVDGAVELRVDGDTHVGRLRNVSRGGVYVETRCDLSAQSEVGLHFTLPDTETPLEPTARVVWQGGSGERQNQSGFGMRFVDISSALVRKLDDYVFDRVLEPNGPATPGMGAMA